MRLGQLVSIKKGRKPVVIASEALPGFKRLLQIDDLRPGAVPKYCSEVADGVEVTPNDIVIAWDGANAATTRSA